MDEGAIPICCDHIVYDDHHEEGVAGVDIVVVLCRVRIHHRAPASDVGDAAVPDAAAVPDTAVPAAAVLPSS